MTQKKKATKVKYSPTIIYAQGSKRFTFVSDLKPMEKTDALEILNKIFAKPTMTVKIGVRRVKA